MQFMNVVILSSRAFNSKQGERLVEVFMLDVDQQRFLSQIFDSAQFDGFQLDGVAPCVDVVTLGLEAKGLNLRVTSVETGAGKLELKVKK